VKTALEDIYDKVYFARLLDLNGETLGNQMVLLNLEMFTNGRISKVIRDAGIIVILLHEFTHFFVRRFMKRDITVFNNSPRKKPDALYLDEIVVRTDGIEVFLEKQRLSP
jgi:hypothetical protein